MPKVQDAYLPEDEGRPEEWQNLVLVRVLSSKDSTGMFKIQQQRTCRMSFLTKIRAFKTYMTVRSSRIL